jgi:hypothetical protein
MVNRSSDAAYTADATDAANTTDTTYPTDAAVWPFGTLC